MTVIQTMIQTDGIHRADIWGVSFGRQREGVRDTSRDVKELVKHIDIPAYRWADRDADI